MPYSSIMHSLISNYLNDMFQVYHHFFIDNLFVLGGRKSHWWRDFSRRRCRHDVHEHSELGRERSRQTNGKRYRKVVGKESSRRTRHTTYNRRETRSFVRSPTSTSATITTTMCLNNTSSIKSKIFFNCDITLFWLNPFLFFQHSPHIHVKVIKIL